MRSSNFYTEIKIDKSLRSPTPHSTNTVKAPTFKVPTPPLRSSPAFLQKEAPQIRNPRQHLKKISCQLLKKNLNSFQISTTQTHHSLQIQIRIIDKLFQKDRIRHHLESTGKRKYLFLKIENSIGSHSATL